MESIQLEQMLGIPIQITPWEGKNQLPLYLVYGRNFDVVSTGSVKFMLVTMQLDGRFNIQQIAGQVEKIAKAANMTVALNLSSMTPYQRKAMTEKGIPFIMLPNQVYLPFLSISLRKHAFRKESVSYGRLQATAQQVFLYLFYHRTSLGISKSNLAEQLNLTRTSITRAIEQLDALGVLQKRDSLRSPILLNPMADLKKIVQEDLIDPVQKRVVIRSQDLPDAVWLAGESCLSEYSMLNPPHMEVYACDKKKISAQAFTVVDPVWENTDGCVQLELWKYSPEPFAKKGRVDKISLYCSLRRSTDERVQGELEMMLEEIEW
ncbi:HTH domain-containing protein [Gemmiger formicilis]|uniref:HTH domain-containing protein n=1 Tax=Gemmiger formicilis TaxID=745368 RepID=UPI00195E9C31|nr:HTH domain-containing protein [Gemmiger formicilis]MBM6715329.1 HTH domain-containing protein [Gemmiger formicilis]